MASLLIISGPPGSGKSAVARHLANHTEHSVLVDGDAFFRFLAHGAIDPWLPEAAEQNETVTQVAAQAAGAFAFANYATLYDGVVWPRYLDTFGATTGLDAVDFVVLLPPVETCVDRVATRTGHGFTDQAATRKMHAEFLLHPAPEAHMLRDLQGDVIEVAATIRSALDRGVLRYILR